MTEIEMVLKEQHEDSIKYAVEIIGLKKGHRFGGAEKGHRFNGFQGCA